MAKKKKPGPKPEVLTTGPSPHTENPDDIFLIGKTDQERAKMLYIRCAWTPAKISKKITDHGTPTTAQKVRDWIKRGGWKKLQDAFHIDYDAERVKLTAEAQALKDTQDEAYTRKVYAEACGALVNAINLKLKASYSPTAEGPLLSKNDISGLAFAMKEIQHVHFRALGIPELISVDPTARFEGIEILPGGADEPRQIARPPDPEE